MTPTSSALTLGPLVEASSPPGVSPGPQISVQVQTVPRSSLVLWRTQLLRCACQPVDPLHARDPWQNWLWPVWRQSASSDTGVVGSVWTNISFPESRSLRVDVLQVCGDGLNAGRADGGVSVPRGDGSLDKMVLDRVQVDME